MRKFYGILAIIYCLFAVGTFIPTTQNIAMGAVLLTFPVIFILGIARFWKEESYPNRKLLSIISSVSLLLIILALFLISNNPSFWNYTKLTFFVGLGLLSVAVIITLINSYNGKVSLLGSIDKTILIFPLAIYATFGVLQFNFFADINDVKRVDELTYKLIHTHEMILNLRSDSSEFSYEQTYDLMTEMFYTVAEYSGGFLVDDREEYSDYGIKLAGPNNSMSSEVEREWLNKVRESLINDIDNEPNPTAKAALQETLDDLFHPNAIGKTALETRLRIYIGQTHLVAINELKN